MDYWSQFSGFLSNLFATSLGDFKTYIWQWFYVATAVVFGGIINMVVVPLVSRVLGGRAAQVAQYSNLLYFAIKGYNMHDSGGGATAAPMGGNKVVN